MNPLKPMALMTAFIFILTGWGMAPKPLPAWTTVGHSAENTDAITVKRDFIGLEAPSPDYLSSIFGPEIIIQTTEEAGKAVIYQTEKSKYDRRYATSTMGRREGGIITEDHLFPDIAKSLPLYLEHQAQKWCEKYPKDFCRSAYYVHEPDLNGLVFTPAGVKILSGPYCEGAFEECAKTIEISIDEMVRIGASGAFWDKPGEKAAK